jgi:hypothetical protein
MALRFQIERIADSRAAGWASIDSRCHFLTPHSALLEAAAEDLDVVNLVATPFHELARDGKTYTTCPNLLAWSGQTPALEGGGNSVVVNTLNSHPVLGTVALLHSHRAIYPLTFGGEESDDWSLCDWCDQCHRKGGLTAWVDAFEPAGGILGGEALVAAILGKIDAIEVTGGPRKAPLMPWVYRLWDAGFRVPLIGASGKDSNRIPLGITRTYARLDGATWVEAVRAGRTVATDGPLLDLSCTNGVYRVVLRGSSIAGNVEIVSNGRRIAEGHEAVEALVEGPVWVAARWSSGGRVAHTSPLVRDGGKADPAACAALLLLVDQTLDWIETTGRFADPRRKAGLLAKCDAARARLAMSS